ncbi:hypothetical protein KIS4809_0069 [Bacillus sp. ZZV12-4809]|nr:hypothetical protein KIS4809_0069 [Bacillus sp. ZZV12-4809]
MLICIIEDDAFRYLQNIYFIFKYFDNCFKKYLLYSEF